MKGTEHSHISDFSNGCCCSPFSTSLQGLSELPLIHKGGLVEIFKPFLRQPCILSRLETGTGAPDLGPLVATGEFINYQAKFTNTFSETPSSCLMDLSLNHTSDPWPIAFMSGSSGCSLVFQDRNTKGKDFVYVLYLAEARPLYKIQNEAGFSRKFFF